ncbi:DNA alkylation repair protein [Crocinitomix catalasitica]|nr:DNA alkylation repair protein [Crocinitomix catalasitica]
MTTQEVMKELEEYGSDSVKNIFIKHGAKEPLYGVKVEDLKKIQKKVKKDHDLSLELYATGNLDAMYLAGLIANEDRISKENLKTWMKEARSGMISEYTVPWIASESDHGYELGLEWIESDVERIAAAGWSTLASHVSIREDADLDIEVYRELLSRVENEIQNEDRNRVRYTMNGFVIAVGSYVTELSGIASEVADKIGKVEVYMGDTSCKVPLASEYIKKVIDKGRLGKKRKMARC